MNPVEEWHLETSHIGKRVLVFDSLDSTNKFVLDRANDTSQDGLVVLADEQTAGRGQHGRVWSCPGGAGVLMSVLLFPPALLCRPSVMTAWASVAACELAHKTTGLEAKIKWPNDVLLQGRKVCGILIEQRCGMVVGIGLNVNQPHEQFIVAGLPQAASLSMYTSRQYQCRDLARQLISELDIGFERIRRGDLLGLKNNWVQRIGLVSMMVELETATQRLRGRLEDMSFEVLQLLLSDGSRLSIVPESVRQLRAL